MQTLRHSTASTWFRRTNTKGFTAKHRCLEDASLTHARRLNMTGPIYSSRPNIPKLFNPDSPPQKKKTEPKDLQNEPQRAVQAHENGSGGPGIVSFPALPSPIAGRPQGAPGLPASRVFGELECGLLLEFWGISLSPREREREGLGAHSPGERKKERV